MGQEMQFSYGDAEIRAELHKKKFDRYSEREDVLVVNELGLAHAKSRIDIAVINGCIHGYEIKSDKDNLIRFASQLDTYRRTLSKLTVVSASKHIPEILHELPAWRGLIEVKIGPRGGIHFITLRRAGQNPDVEMTMMAHLLWHSEATELLLDKGASRKNLRRPRRELYTMIADAMSEKEITRAIRDKMQSRKGWRVEPVLHSYGG